MGKFILTVPKRYAIIGIEEYIKEVSPVLMVNIIDLPPIAPLYQLLFTAVSVFLAIILAKVLIARHSYKCRECKTEFNVKWYKGAKLSVHNLDGRVLKCPCCKKYTWCDYDDI